MQIIGNQSRTHYDTDLEVVLDDLLSAGESLTRRLLGTSSGDAPRWPPDEEPGDGPNDGSYVSMHDAAAVMTREAASFGPTAPVTRD